MSLSIFTGPVQQMEAVVLEKERLKKSKKETDDMLERVYSLSDVCKRIIAEEHNLNKNFLDFLDRYVRSNKRDYRKLVEALYRQFDKEQQEKRAQRSSEFNELLQLHARSRTLENIVKSYGRSDNDNAKGYSFF